MTYTAKIGTQWAGCYHEFELEELPTHEEFLEICTEEVWSSIISGCALYDEAGEVVTEFAKG